MLPDASRLILARLGTVDVAAAMVALQVVSFNALLAACGAMWPNVQCLLNDLRMKFFKPVS